MNSRMTKREVTAAAEHEHTTCMEIYRKLREIVQHMLKQYDIDDSVIIFDRFMEENARKIDEGNETLHDVILENLKTFSFNRTYTISEDVRKMYNIEWDAYDTPGNIIENISGRAIPGLQTSLMGYAQKASGLSSNGFIFMCMASRIDDISLLIRLLTCLYVRTTHTGDYKNMFNSQNFSIYAGQGLCLIASFCIAVGTTWLLDFTCDSLGEMGEVPDYLRNTVERRIQASANNREYSQWIHGLSNLSFSI